MIPVPNDLGEDPRGIDLWRRRNLLVPDLVLRSLEIGLPEGLADRFADSGTPWDVAGVGSSEAHARFLVYGLQGAGIPARFVPLSAYWTGRLPLRRAATGVGQVVFSQGFSSNAQIALYSKFQYKERILATAATVDNLVDSGKNERADRLHGFQSEGGHLWPLSPSEEYTILIRVLGPAVAFMEVLKLLDALHPDAAILPGADTLADAMDEAHARGVEAAERWNDTGNHSPDLAAVGFPADLLINISCKWVEGLFFDAPGLHDALGLAHGPFQQRTKSPRPLLVLSGPDRTDSEAVAALERLWESLNAPVHEIRSPLPFPASLLYYECFFNAMLCELAAGLDVHQVDWPGKGRDGPTYGLNRPI